ncbi:hypothetical protein H9X75_01075 [Fusobacterium mortiferum]|uniref:hypothetical protein n=1 Tax=Fusobacterium mortiferum TaxID=850 RepID=UPI00195CFCCC|nr:hypothetical protein [Fusobacterium mortiferum]
MDTIEIGLKIKDHINLTIQELETMKREIEGLMSPFGYNYCNYLSFSSAKKIIIKISYPRFFAGTNAYLITKRSECFQVQNHFVNNFLSDILWSNYIEGISLNRVDIPFTYLMETTEEFASYQNIYYIFAHVYDKKIENARTKAYLDLINKGYETLIYAPNGSVGKSYNNRLEVYNQALNLSEKLDEDMKESIFNTYKDLPQRIRMEVSKRIRLRNLIGIYDFANYDILGNYFLSYKNYILENILDFKVIDELYNYWANILSQKLIAERNNGKINYANFIYQNQQIIYDYEIVRRAFGISIDNENTRENAITRVRQVLIQYENTHNIILMDVYGTLKKIETQIKTTYLLD